MYHEHHQNSNTDFIHNYYVNNIIENKRVSLKVISLFIYHQKHHQNKNKTFDFGLFASLKAREDPNSFTGATPENLDRAPALAGRISKTLHHCGKGSGVFVIKEEGTIDLV